MTGYIINNSNPSAVTVEIGNEKTTHANIDAAWQYVDGKREEEQLDLFGQEEPPLQLKVVYGGQDDYEGFGKAWLREAGLLDD